MLQKDLSTVDLAALIQPPTMDLRHNPVYGGFIGCAIQDLKKAFRALPLLATPVRCEGV